MPALLPILKAVADETRYNLVELLLAHDFCVQALAQRLQVSESAVSQHLKVLRDAGVVRGEKRGYFTHYQVDRDLLKQAAAQLAALAETPPASRECKEHFADAHCCKGKENNCC